MVVASEVLRPERVLDPALKLGARQAHVSKLGGDRVGPTKEEANSLAGGVRHSARRAVQHSRPIGPPKADAQTAVRGPIRDGVESTRGGQARTTHSVHQRRAQ